MSTKIKQMIKKIEMLGHQWLIIIVYNLKNHH